MASIRTHDANRKEGLERKWLNATVNKWINVIIESTRSLCQCLSKIHFNWSAIPWERFPVVHSLNRTEILSSSVIKYLGRIREETVLAERSRTFHCFAWAHFSTYSQKTCRENGESTVWKGQGFNRVKIVKIGYNNGSNSVSIPRTHLVNSSTRRVYNLGNLVKNSRDVMRFVLSVSFLDF